MGTHTDEDDATELSSLGENFLSQAAAAITPGLDTEGRQLFGEITKTLRSLPGAGSSVHADVERHADDDTIADEGRRRLTREAFDKGTSTVKERSEQALTGITVLEKRLRAQALPKAPTDAATVSTLRDEVRLTLEAAGDPLSAAERIVTGPDRYLAGVLLSRWGRTLLRTLGDDDGDMAEALVLRAVQAAAEHGSDAERKAAKALEGVVPLRKAQAAVATSAGMYLHGAEGRLR